MKVIGGDRFYHVKLDESYYAILDSYYAILDHVHVVSKPSDIPQTGMVFPYYVPEKLDEFTVQILKEEIAYTLYSSMLEYNRQLPNTLISGCRAGFIRRLNLKLNLSNAELDSVYMWCNPLKFLAGVGLIIWGSSYYKDGLLIRGHYDYQLKKLVGITSELMNIFHKETK